MVGCHFVLCQNCITCAHFCLWLTVSKVHHLCTLTGASKVQLPLHSDPTTSLPVMLPLLFGPAQATIPHCGLPKPHFAMPWWFDQPPIVLLPTLPSCPHGLTSHKFRWYCTVNWNFLILLLTFRSRLLPSGVQWDFMGSCNLVPSAGTCPTLNYLCSTHPCWLVTPVIAACMLYHTLSSLFFSCHNTIVLLLSLGDL